VPPGSLTRAPGALAAVVGSPFTVAVLAALAGWARANAPFPLGLTAMAAWAGLMGLLWLLASLRLPRHEAPWTALLPGAATVAGGTLAIHVVTVYYLANKLATASALYGTLGLTATLLVYLFLIGRMIVVAAELNAVVWERSHPQIDSPTEETSP
jgi:uncharacterized BrkB/YihY/UPF0761 family membrane protein